MKHRAGALVLLAVLVGASACGSGHNAASHTAPSKNDSYAWQPIAGGPSLVCSVGYRQLSGMIDYRGRPYYCKLPTPAGHRGYAGIDFTGPTTVSVGPVPLKRHQLRLHINFGTRHPAVLRVDFGDGTHWQRSVTRSSSAVDVVHTYAPMSNAFLLITLRNKTGYLALEGIGPFRAPLSGPRTRDCAYIADGKGGRLSATPSLPCAQAERLFRHYSSRYPPGNPPGYHCRFYGLPPWGSDAGVTSCTSGARAFVFTTNQ